LVAVIPILYIVSAVTMALITFVLSSVKQLTIKNLFLVSGFVSIGVGLLFGSPSPFGVRDQVVGVLIFSALTMLCLSLGVLTWWRLAGIGGAASLGSNSEK